MKSTACFTGKRPQNLPWGYNEDDLRCMILKDKLKQTIERAVQNGYTHFISGMALGVDTWAAILVLELKKQHPDISLEAAIPCKNQALKWNRRDREQYNSLLAKCDKVTYISESYTPYCMIERNMYMVDNSSLLIAVYDNSGGGSGNTLKYAERRGIDIEILW